MKRNVTLLVTSVLANLFFALHFADDIVRGIEQGDLLDYTGILLTAAWLYVALALAHRRAGLVILFLFSILAAGVPAIHMTGSGMTGGRIANSSGMFFWTFTLIALGVTGLVSAGLSAQQLWRLRRL